VAAATASTQAHEAAAIRKRTMVIRVVYYTALRAQTTPAAAGVARCLQPEVKSNAHVRNVVLEELPVRRGALIELQHERDQSRGMASASRAGRFQPDSRDSGDYRPRSAFDTRSRAAVSAFRASGRAPVGEPHRPDRARPSRSRGDLDELLTRKEPCWRVARIGFAALRAGER